MFQSGVVIRDHIHRNKVPCECLYDAKSPIQMSQGLPKQQQKHVGGLKYVGGGGDEVFNKIVTFCLTDFGIKHQKIPRGYFYTFLQR